MSRYKTVDPRLAGALAKARRRLDGADTSTTTTGTTTASTALTCSQLRFWLAQALEPESLAFAAPMVLRLDGDLVTPAFDAAFDDLVAAHDVLRTRYVRDADGKVSTCIDAPPLGIVQHHVLHQEPGEDVLECVQIAELLDQPFLLDGPPVRVDLFEWPPSTHVMLMRMHHTNTDGTTRHLLLTELFDRYAAHRAGTAEAVTASDDHYARFGARQAAIVETDVLAAANYVRRLVASVDLDVRSPLNRAPGEVATRHGAAVIRTLPRSRVAELAQKASVRPTTRFAVLMAAYQVALRRWTGSPQFAIAFPVAGRETDDDETTVGCFINTVAVPTSIHDGATLASVFDAMAQSILEALEHQHVPIERIVEGVSELRGDAGRRLGRYWMDMRPGGRLPTVPGLSIADVAVIPPPVADLSLVVDEIGDEIVLTFEYSPALLDAPNVEGVADDIVAVLHLDPTAPLSLAVTDPVVLAIAEEYGAVLGCEVASDTSFFDAGGSSLSALHLVSRLSRRLGTRIELPAIFECPTPRLLRARLAVPTGAQDPTDHVATRDDH